MLQGLRVLVSRCKTKRVSEPFDFFRVLNSIGGLGELHTKVRVLKASSVSGL